MNNPEELAKTEELNYYRCENCQLHFWTEPLNIKKVVCPRCGEKCEAVYLA